MATPYTGSGPYCYANSLVMVLGPDAPAPVVVETLTGSPYGVQLIGGTLPMFDPYGWDPELGLDAAAGLLGYRCTRTSGGTPDEAMARLRTAAARGPVLVGPVDLGLLLYRPGTPLPGGGDHYVVVLAVEGDTVLLHDPEGHPYATLGVAPFLEAWRADSVTYTDTPYVMRTDFVREEDVTEEEALRRSLPGAVRWLSGREDLPVPPGTLGGAAAVEGLAALVSRGLDPQTRELLGDFAIRVGARRLNDAARGLARLGLWEPAAVAAGQARALGALQGPLVAGDDRALVAGLRRLAPGYERWRTSLTEALSTGAPVTGEPAVPVGGTPGSGRLSKVDLDW
ncbi:hypothetical protein ACFYT4_08575 [Streptomyces sp. NPDC004609]|uniref:hypothetical protein n=1 Tax=Streptomyces sp. NPDC004609 TaxID=3364704 RepID=UPI00367A4786